MNKENMGTTEKVLETMRSADKLKTVIRYPVK